MNKDIESRLKELRLATPPPELRTSVLSNARAAWRDKSKSPILHMQFRQVVTLAASLVLFTGVIVSLNRIEERRMCQSLNLSWEKNQMPSENIKFLEEMGLDRKYSLAIANVSQITKIKPFVNRFDKDLNL